MSADAERTAGLVQSEFLIPAESDVHLQREPTVTHAATFSLRFQFKCSILHQKAAK